MPLKDKCWLGIAGIFILWLFVAMADARYLVDKHLSLQERRIGNADWEVTRFEAGGFSFPIIINKRGGESYRYTANPDTKYHGWEQIGFTSDPKLK